MLLIFFANRRILNTLVALEDQISLYLPGRFAAGTGFATIVKLSSRSDLCSSLELDWNRILLGGVLCESGVVFSWVMIVVGS